MKSKSQPITFVIVLSFCFLFSKIPCNAQAFDARVEFTDTSPGFVDGVFYVNLIDTVSTSQIEIELIDTMEDSSMFNQVYIYDQTVGLPAGLTWTRQGTEVHLGVGNLPKSAAWLGRVRLKDTYGQWNNWYEFLFN